MPEIAYQFGGGQVSVVDSNVLHLAVQGRSDSNIFGAVYIVEVVAEPAPAVGAVICAIANHAVNDKDDKFASPVNQRSDVVPPAAFYQATIAIPGTLT